MLPVDEHSGSSTLTSAGLTVDGPDGDLAGSHSHDSNPGTLGADGSRDSAGDGYLSPGSHSLDSVGLITTGRGDEIETDGP